MDTKLSNPPKPSSVNLKQLPPIDPFVIMYSSSSEGKLNSSSARASATVDSDEDIEKNVVVEEPSSISSDKKGGNTRTISPTQTQSADEKGMNKGSARSHLYEFCAANHWKPPIFECYKEEGPSHQRMFTFKVIIEIEEALGSIIECYGAPRGQKKTAADDTAEGALWYLKSIGFSMMKKKKKKKKKKKNQ